MGCVLTHGSALAPTASSLIWAWHTPAQAWGVPGSWSLPPLPLLTFKASCSAHIRCFINGVYMAEHLLAGQGEGEGGRHRKALCLSTGLTDPDSAAAAKCHLGHTHCTSSPELRHHSFRGLIFCLTLSRTLAFLWYFGRAQRPAPSTATQWREDSSTPVSSTTRLGCRPRGTFLNYLGDGTAARGDGCGF